MPYRDNLVFKTPPPATTIYRYLTLGKYLSTLQAGALWFTNVRVLEGHEGRLGAADGRFHHCMAGLARAVSFEPYVSCWTEGPHESHAMWKLYVGDGEGVCIRSTVGRLIKAIHAEPAEVHIGAVQYVEHNSLKEPILDGNLLRPYLFKRAVLESEHEVRAVVTRPGSQEVACTVVTNLPTLVDGLIVHPGAGDWYVRAIDALSKASGVEVRASRSAIDEQPPPPMAEAEMLDVLRETARDVSHGLGGPS